MNFKNTNFFEYVDCFGKTSTIKSILIRESICINPQITISIPTYKRSDSLKEALNSALNQNVDFEYEIMIVDNNQERNDDTEKVIQKYASNKISYYKNNENIGQIGNWNRLFILCKSEYLVMLHDDDVLSPYFLRDTMKIIKSDIDIALLGVGKFEWNSDKTDKPIFRDSAKRKALLRFTSRSNYAFFMFGAPSGSIFKKEIVLKLGGFNEDFYPSSDYCLIMQMIEKYNVYFYEKKLLLYRISGNITSLISTQKKWIESDYWFRKYLGKRFKYSDNYIKFCTLMWSCLYFTAVKKIDNGFNYNIDGHKLYRLNKLEILFFKIFHMCYYFYWNNRLIIKKI